MKQETNLKIEKETIAFSTNSLIIAMQDQKDNSLICKIQLEEEEM